MDKTKEQELRDLKAQREQWITRTFWMGLEIALIFAIPAVLGALLGKQLGGGAIRIVILVATFGLSWFVVVRRYKKAAAKLKSIDTKITELQKLKQEFSSDPEVIEE